MNPRCAWHRLGLGSARTSAPPHSSATLPGLGRCEAGRKSGPSRVAPGRESPDSCRAGRFLLPDTRTTTLRSFPARGGGGRCVLTAAGGRAPGPLRGSPPLARTQRRSRKPSHPPSAPHQTRLLEPGPDRSSLAIHGAGGKLVLELQSPLPWTGTHIPGPMHPQCSEAPSPRGPHPAIYLLPRRAQGSGQPAARSCAPEPERLQDPRQERELRTAPSRAAGSGH